jgi:hypothetical protein
MRWWALLLLAPALGAEDDRPAKDVKDPALSARINGAIDKGVAYLKSVQRADGYWGGLKDRPGSGDLSHVGGLTALALYALSASGVPKDDPAIARGLAFVVDHKDAFGPGKSSMTYAASLLVLALTRIDPAEHRELIHETAGRLIEGQLSDGMWTYGPQQTVVPPPARGGDRAAWRKASTSSSLADNSNTQFAVLALWAAQDMAEYEVPVRTWESVRDHFVKAQVEDGGWGYRKNERRSSVTMTAAGAVSLVYALASLDGAEGALDRARAHPAAKRALPLLPLAPAAKGAIGKAASPWFNYYLVYSIERVGTVFDLDIATWYVPGALWLVEQQHKDGSWGGFRGTLPPPQPRGAAVEYPYETSLALLFLTRATRPYVTTGGKDKPMGPVTRKDASPDGVEGVFDLYVATRAEEREALVAKLAKLEAVGLFVAKLRDNRQPVRAAAFELLMRLLEKPLLFDAAASPEEREVMLGPIEAFWKEHHAKLMWDDGKGRFVTP